MSSDAFAVAVAAVMIAADLLVLGCVCAWRAWRRRHPTRLDRILSAHARAEADDFGAVIRAVTDDNGRAL